MKRFQVLLFLFFIVFSANIKSQSCNDMGVENGWGTWKAEEGYHKTGANGEAPVFFAPKAPTSPRFVIKTGAAIDACTPGGGGSALPVVAPGFGNSSIQLGQYALDGVNGNCSNNGTYPAPGAIAGSIPPAVAAGNGCSERLTNQFLVSSQNINFVYAYAIVVENPTTASGHTSTSAPYAEIYMLDSKGDTIPCSHKRYTGDITGGIAPGFYRAACSGGSGVSNGIPYSNGNDVNPKPWTIVGVNLTNYVGQTISIVITNTDCARGGHYCYSYWDFSCTPLSTNPASYCKGSSVSITAPTDALNGFTYQWDRNGNAYTGTPNSTAQTITPNPQPGDTFNVKVIQASGCNFNVQYVPIANNTKADFSFQGSCGQMNFSDKSTATTVNKITGWTWSFPGGTPATSTQQNPSVTFPPQGTYTVQLIATSTAGCTGTEHTFTVTPVPPVANFSANQPCKGSPTQFTDLTPGSPIAWSWDFGDGSVSNLQNPSNTYNAAGTYTVTLIAATSCGIDTVQIPITVNPLPTAKFTSNIVCFNNPTGLTDQSTGSPTQWNWDLGDGNISTQQSPSHTYGNAGTFTVKLVEANSFGCKDSVQQNVVVNPLPVASFVSTKVCFNSPTCFTDQSTISSGNITTWGWTFGDPASGANNTSTIQKPCHTFTTTSNTNITLTVTSDGNCQGTLSLPVTFIQPPTARFTSTNICVNSASVFKDNSIATPGNTIASWIWSFGDGPTTSTQQNPTHLYGSTGTYTVTSIITSAAGCKDTISNPVTVFGKPTALFSEQDSGCAPVCHSFKDSSQANGGSIASWQWSFPGGVPGTSSQKDPASICYVNPGDYGALLIVTTNNGCVDTVQHSNIIHVFDWPNPDFCINPPSQPVSNPVFSFCDQWTPKAEVNKWIWDFGDGSPADSVNIDPVHSYSLTATNNDSYSYNVGLTVQNTHGCLKTIFKMVELIPEFDFYIPNSFTPNGDGENDFFFAKGQGVKDYKIWVFDRWGNLIWSCNENGSNVNWDKKGEEGMPSGCIWDGKLHSGRSATSGEVVQQDVYVWKVQLTDVFDKDHSYVGHVTLIK